MNTQEFRENAHFLADEMTDYLENIQDFSIMPSVEPKSIYRQIPDMPPEKGEDFAQIYTDFQQLILPNMTHWQNPSFFGYFPANSSPPSVLAEMLTATLGAQCMVWQTSPAATECEERMMEWLLKLCGLPETWHGVIQDTASTGTLCALLTAREQASDFQINETGFDGKKYICYCSEETHSSMDKAVKIAGFGIQNLRKIPTDENHAMIPEALEKAILEDAKKENHVPCVVVGTFGTTGSTAIDPLRKIGEICKKHQVWFHIDAAYGGTALILPHVRSLADGAELADSFVFNPHKWMGVNFDCTAYFVKDKETLLRTFSIMPEYLKTGIDSEVNNYRDWGIQLGRRFRALKLWFVIRTYGAEGLQKMLQNHFDLATKFAEILKTDGRFEILAPISMNLVCFRYKPSETSDENELEKLNSELMRQLNATGKVFLSHTKLKGKYAIRAVFGQTNVSQNEMEGLWTLINEKIKRFSDVSEG